VSIARTGNREIGDLESGNLGSRNRTIPAFQSRNHKAQIGQSEAKRADVAPKVQLEIYDFGFEMQESSDFEIPDFLIPDLRFPIYDFFAPGLTNP